MITCGYRDIDATPTLADMLVDSPHAAMRMAQPLIENQMETLDVQPPTEASLTASAEKGVEVGRELHTQGFGKTAVMGALHRITQERYTEWPTNDNAWSFVQAAQEAYDGNSVS